MKRAEIFVVGIFLMVLLGGCALQNPRTRALVVYNDTTNQQVRFVGVTSYHGVQRKIGHNVLPDETSLPPGGRVTIHFSDSVAEIGVSINSETVGQDDDYHGASRSLFRNSIVGRKRDVIEARYIYDDVNDDYLIEFDGPGYQLQEID